MEKIFKMRRKRDTLRDLTHKKIFNFFYARGGKAISINLLQNGQGYKARNIINQK